MSDTSVEPSTLDDHAFAVWAAEQAGEVLLRVRGEGLEGRELKDAGDRAAQELLARVLAEHRPDDAVLSEEAADDKARLSAKRVWIIDPLGREAGLVVGRFLGENGVIGPVLGKYARQQLLGGAVAGVLQLAALQTLGADLEQPLAGLLGRPDGEGVVVEGAGVNRCVAHGRHPMRVRS